MFTLYTVKPPQGEGWSDWNKDANTSAGKKTYCFEKHRKIEFGCHATGTWIMTAASTGYWFKSMLQVTVRPFDDTQ
jgi:hypothetical protein